MIWEHHCRNAPLDLSGVVLPRELIIEALPPLVFLDGAVFGSAFALQSTKPVRGYASFAGTQFLGGVRFLGLTFEAMLYFAGAGFRGRAEFRGTSFNRGTYFNDARFHETAEFDVTRWSGEPVFAGCVFEKGGAFYSACFTSQPRFPGSRFIGPTSFEKVVFEKGALFGGAEFCSGMQFAESDFGGWADFRARWMKAEHADVPLASFQGAKFRAGVSFENRRFGGRTSFANASFAKAPIFHGGEIHQDTDFSGAEFLETTGFDAARAYRTLRLEMERWRARLEESRFFGLEQQALRQSTELTRGERVVSWLYEKTAKYGGSFLRPLVLLVATQLLAGVAFLLVYLSSSFSWDFSGSETVRFVRFWIGDLFTPFGTIRGEAGSPGGLVAIFKPSDGKLLVLGAISFARTIGTVVFLSLFLLALRRRFRIS